jgi:Do/DeqQ family serine protease
MKVRNLISTLFAAMIGGLVVLFAYEKLDKNKNETNIPPYTQASQPVHFASLNSQDARDAAYPDFTYAAERSLPCVVHVKVKTMYNMYTGSGNPIFDFFYGYREQKQVPREGFGSGVIISSDGYVITNNHVIDKADEIEVTLNDRRTFTAQLIGTDPTTDLALLKFDESSLPYLTYGDSEALRVGEWVLAVGNPLNLTSTVTAGIVSAKARQLGILASADRMGIESFIQTDAAVNRGNSGGALVNTKGELVGINTAIASSTGDFSGNAFAIPVTIVKKVIDDLKEYGHVQRAMLGITIEEVTSEFAKDKNISRIGGIYVRGVQDNSAAQAAGIKEGDIIIAFNNIPINTYSELQEQLSKYRPNDKVILTVLRNEKTQQIEVILRNIDGNTEIVRGQPNILGAKFEEISNKDKQTLGISSGVRVKEVGQGRLKREGVRDGFIITAINDHPVKSIKDIETILSSVKAKGRVVIDGIYPSGQVTYYVFAK